LLALILTAVPVAPQGAVAGASTPRAALACNPVAAALVTTPTTDQLMTVIAPTLRSDTATFNLYRRVGACWQLVDGPYVAFVGGHGVTTSHREGDDATPIGLFGIQTTMYGVDPNPGVVFHYHQLVCGDWWDEQPSSSLYNHFVHAGCGTTPPFGGDSEPLWEVVPQYDYFAAIEFNRFPIVPGRGSAIFLHVSIGQATTGCVALPRVDLLRVLRALRPSLHPEIDISTQVLTPN
jgi:L,D-peptidoglycan transpeptidase YkuD (ErfK/YbiS/YcfS/YnhG family)